MKIDIRDFEDRSRSKNKLSYSYKDETISFDREDPFGFWKISTNKGELPKKIADNVYTDIRYAETDVSNYLTEKYASKAKA